MAAELGSGVFVLICEAANETPRQGEVFSHMSRRMNYAETNRYLSQHGRFFIALAEAGAINMLYIYVPQLRTAHVAKRQRLTDKNDVQL